MTKKAPFIPDESDPDFAGFRFVATAYRTTRALLQCRRLLPIGSLIREAMEQGSLTRTVPIDPSSPLPLPTFTSDLQGIPTVPSAGTAPDQLATLAKVHSFTAIFLGVDPADPCLHWFNPDLFNEFFPDLVQFEAQLLAFVGRGLLRGGRVVAMERMCKVFGGDPSPYERRDWSMLPSVYLRDFASTSQEDDRTVMVAQLESIAARAKDALDLRTELAARRAIAAVQGLTFQDTEKQNRELALLLSEQQAPQRSLSLANARAIPQ